MEEQITQAEEKSYKQLQWGNGAKCVQEYHYTYWYDYVGQNDMFIRIRAYSQNMRCEYTQSVQEQ